MRDFTKFQCPVCSHQKHSHFGRTCENCGHRGDWIQPNEIMTYASYKKFLGIESIAELLPELVKLHTNQAS